MRWITKYIVGSMAVGAVLGASTVVLDRSAMRVLPSALEKATAACVLGVFGAVVGPVLPFVIVYHVIRS